LTDMLLLISKNLEMYNDTSRLMYIRIDKCTYE
jgi:hypothetical protein